MRRLFIPAASLLLALFIVLPAHALSLNHLWSRSVGGNNSEVCQGIAVDAAGNVYVTGYFSGTTDLGGGSLVSVGGSDIFLAKYSPSGTHLWSKRFGGTANDHGYGVGVDASGNVAVTGDFQGTADFDIGSLTSAGGVDVFLARFTPAGGYVGGQRYGGTTNDFAYSLAVDAGGNIIITGSFTGTAGFGGASLVSVGGSDIYLAKYTSAGTHVWSERFGGTVTDEALGVAVDPAGNIAISGDFQGTTNLGGSNLVSVGSIEIFLARYNSAGTHSWSKRFGSIAQDYGLGVAMDAAGNVFSTGYFQGTGDFGPVNLVSAGGFDIFLVKYDAAGTNQWSKRFGGTNSDYGIALAAGPGGNVVMTGYFYDTLNFGGGALVSNGDIDCFVAEFDASGVHQRSRSFGGTLGDQGRAVASTGTNDVVAGGYFYNTADFGGGLLGSAGSSDAFLARYTGQSPPPVITSISDIGNDQGRKVKITFNRSAHDNVSSPTPVDHYEAYRRNDAPPAAAAAGLAGLSSRQLLDAGWTEVGTVHAHTANAYSMDVPTIGDSTIALGPYESVFYVRAATNVSATFFDSPLDSGYSVDNLAPGVPQHLTYSTGNLSWDKSSAEDFDYFSVYGSNTNNFGAATLVDYSVATALNVTGSPYTYYFVTATDFSGNEGRPASVNTLSGVGGTPQHYVLSLSNYPNPFNPETTVKYTLPSKGEVTVTIYDASGARVATLVDHALRNAGAHEIHWSGRGDNGAIVSSGVYFARIDHPSGTMTRKMVLLK